MSDVTSHTVESVPVQNVRRGRGRRSAPREVGADLLQVTSRVTEEEARVLAQASTPNLGRLKFRYPIVRFFAQPRSTSRETCGDATSCSMTLERPTDRTHINALRAVGFVMEAGVFSSPR